MRVLIPTLILTIAAGVWAQYAPTLSVNVNVVTLLATVHDRDGRIVKNLNPDDFVLEEDGVPQISAISRKSLICRLTIGLLVDTQPQPARVLHKGKPGKL